MNKKILAALQTKFAGVDAAILTRIADKKAVGVTDESQVQSIADGVGFADVLNSYGDFRANGATLSAVQNYETKHNIKDGKPIDVPNPNTDPPAGINKLIAEGIAAGLKPIAEKLTQLEGEKAANERLAQVVAKAKEYGISEVEAKRYNISQDTDLDAYFKDVKQEKINEGAYISPESPEQKIKTNEQELLDLIGKS